MFSLPHSQVPQLESSPMQYMGAHPGLARFRPNTDATLLSSTSQHHHMGVGVRSVALGPIVCDCVELPTLGSPTQRSPPPRTREAQRTRFPETQPPNCWLLVQPAKVALKMQQIITGLSNFILEVLMSR